MAITITTRRSGEATAPALHASSEPVSEAAAEAIRELFENQESAGATVGEPLLDLPEQRSAGGVLQHAVPAAHLGADRAAGTDRTAGTDGAGSARWGVPVEVVRVRPGDKVKLVAHDDGAPAGRSQHEYEVPAGFPAGLHHYHPARQARKSARTAERIPGPVIVEGDVDDVDGIAHARDRTMVIDERPLDSAMTPTPTALTATLNGQVLPDVDIRPGEIQRWRVLNADPQRPMWLHVEGHTLYQIGQDGIPFANARPARSIMLVSGNRAELLVRATRPGRYRIYAASYDQGLPTGPHPDVELATLAVDGRPVFNPLPRTLVDQSELAADPVATRTVHVGADTSEGTVAVTMRTDGKGLDLARIDQYVTAGTMEEWVLVNDDATQHRIHLHGHPFQVVDVQGIPAGDPSWQTDPETWWDTYRLPANGQVTIRAYFRPTPSR